MSGSLNQMPKYRANLSNEGHNLGMIYQFTSAPGMILPIYHHILNQGEKVSFNCNINTNVAIPLVKPAQLNVREKVDVFFVPLQMMLTTFGQSFYGGNDYLTSLLGSQGSASELSNLPVFDFFSSSGIIFGSLEDLNRSGYLDDSPYNVPFLDSRGFDTLGKGAFRLLMHLDYNPEVVFGKIRGDLSLNIPEILSIQPNVFPASLLAYHAIYENYYRNDDREKRRLRSYQFDYAISSADGILNATDTKSLLSLHYHSRIKDYFTSLKVSPIASALNIGASFDDLNAHGDLMFRVLNFLSDQETKASDNVDNDLNYDSSSPFENKRITQFNLDLSAGANKVSTAGLRTLFAVEKLNRIMGRARKDYDSQTLAHLGFKVPRDVKHEITYLGGYEGGIGVRQHYSQANTYNSNTGDGAELGEQFGTAEGGVHGDHVINFVAPCHGVFMAVHYIIPEVTYPQGVCLDKSNMLTDRLSFFIPEFDKLGMQPLFAYEAANRVIPYYESNQFNYYYIPTNIVLGWQYRYEQYKRKYNRHSVAFLRPRVPDDSGNIPVNSWSPWIVGAEPFDFFKFTVSSEQQGSPITDAFPACFTFWVSPTYLDNLFVNGYNTHVGLVPDYAYTSGVHEYTEDERATVIDYIEHPWLLFQTDMFMHQASFSCKLISKMSKYGEPELI